MPIVTIQSPTGQSFQIEAPEGATDEQILSFAQSQGLFDQPAQPAPTAGQQAVGGLENIAALASGALAEPVAGLAGIAQTLNPFADEGAGARAVAATREALTFQPGTEAGQQQQAAIGEALAPIGEALSSAERFLGEETLDATGSPALASVAHALPTAALEALGLKGAKRVTAVRPPSNKLIEKTIVEAAPDVDRIKSASRAIFKELDDSGVSVNQKALGRLENTLDRVAKKEGIRERVTPEAFGAIQEVKKDIALGNPIPISQMDELRTVAKNSIVPTDANKTRAGTRIVDEIDSFMDDLKSGDIATAGRIPAAAVGKRYKAARTLWGRAKRSEMLQDAIEMGASRKAGVEKGIRNELNNLLNRKKSRKFLSKEDVAAIRRVTDGDFKQNFASLVGGMGLKLENSPSLFSSVIGGGGLGAIASTAPGLAGAVAPVAIGAVTVGTMSKEIAKKITRNRAGFLEAMQRAGNDAERITRAYLQAVPKKSRSISDLSDLLMAPNINLNALENVANQTVREAAKAASFKRELLQAAATLGVGGASGARLQEAEDNNE